MSRLTANDSLDSTFGSGGKVTTDFTGGLDSAFAVVVQPDGNSVLGGLATKPATAKDFALVRYLGDKISRR